MSLDIDSMEPSLYELYNNICIFKKLLRNFLERRKPPSDPETHGGFNAPKEFVKEVLQKLQNAHDEVKRSQDREAANHEARKKMTQEEIEFADAKEARRHEIYLYKLSVEICEALQKLNQIQEFKDGKLLIDSVAPSEPYDAKRYEEFVSHRDNHLKKEGDYGHLRK